MIPTPNRLQTSPTHRLTAIRAREQAGGGAAVQSGAGDRVTVNMMSKLEDVAAAAGNLPVLVAASSAGIDGRRALSQ